MQELIDIIKIETEDDLAARGELESDGAGRDEVDGDEAADGEDADDLENVKMFPHFEDDEQLPEPMTEEDWQLPEPAQPRRRPRLWPGLRPRLRPRRRGLRPMDDEQLPEPRQDDEQLPEPMQDGLEQLPEPVQDGLEQLPEPMHDDDVVIVSETCMCSKCKKLRTQQAEIPVANPKRGGQRRETSGQSDAKKSRKRPLLYIYI